MFYDGDMQVADHEWEQVGREAHEVVTAAKQAGVWCFGGGFLDENQGFVVTTSGETKSHPLRPESSPLGGFAVIQVGTKEEAIEWATRIGKSCRCDQEVREMIWDEESTN